MSAVAILQSLPERSTELAREVFRRNLNTDLTRGRGNRACRRAFDVTGRIFLSFTGWGNSGSIARV